jgi:HSP20 family molecular chaperone IbpA
MQEQDPFYDALDVPIEIETHPDHVIFTVFVPQINQEGLHGMIRNNQFIITLTRENKVVRGFDQNSFADATHSYQSYNKKIPFSLPVQENQMQRTDFLDKVQFTVPLKRFAPLE